MEKSSDFRFKVELPPTLNQIYKPAQREKYTTTIKSKEAKNWQTYCGTMARQELIKKGLESDLKGHYRVDVDMYLKRDRDVDSSLKLLLDSLEGILYKNDKQVKEVRCKKYKSQKAYLDIYIYNL